MKRVVAWVAVVVVAIQLVAVVGFAGYDAWRVRQYQQGVQVELDMTAARLRGSADAARAEADRLRAELMVLLASGNTAAADDCRRRVAAADRAADEAHQRQVMAEAEFRVYKETGQRPSPGTKKG